MKNKNRITANPDDMQAVKCQFADVTMKILDTSALRDSLTQQLNQLIAQRDKLRMEIIHQGQAEASVGNGEQVAEQAPS